MSDLSPLSGVKRKSDFGDVRAAIDPGCVKTPMANFRVELPSRLRRCKSRFVLATTFGRRQLRKRFCASLARASFHTAWTRNGHWLVHQGQLRSSAAAIAWVLSQ